MVFDYVAGKLDWLSNDLPIEGKLAEVATIGSLAVRNPSTCFLTEKASEVRNRLEKENSEVCVVINDAQIVLGLFRRDAGKSGEHLVAQVMESGPATFRPYVIIEEMAGYIQKKKVDIIIVTTSDGRLLGTLYGTDLAVQATLQGTKA